jgi:hypothetical protein
MFQRPAASQLLCPGTSKKKKKKKKKKANRGLKSNFFVQ